MPADRQETAMHARLRRPALLRLSALAALAVSVLAPAAAGAAGAAPELGLPADRIHTVSPGAAAAREFAPGQVVVRFRAGVDAGERATARRTEDMELQDASVQPALQLLDLPAGTSVPAAVAELERRPDVLYAEPNFYLEPLATPDDPGFGRTWGLHNTGQDVFGVRGGADADIDAPEAWDLTTGSSAVTVAVVDTGVALGHPDLAPNLWTNAGERGGGRETNRVDDDRNGFVDDWRGWDFADGDNDPDDEWYWSDPHRDDVGGHGTHVAGTIAARGDNGIGVAGVTWSSRIMPLRIYSERMTAWRAADAFRYAGANGAQIANGSFGGPNFSQALADAVRESPRTLFVVAAGNDGTDNDAKPQYPCNIEAPNLVCVAASDQSDRLASFSNRGARSVDLAAPGTNVLSTYSKRTALSETFESRVGENWTGSGGTGTWGTADLSNGDTYLADSPAGRYADNADTTVRSVAPFGLSGRGCRLHFSMRLDTESGYDFLVIEAARGGDAQWTRMAAWHGSTGGGWKLDAQTNLSAFDGAERVYLRFRLISDASNTGEGADLDDLRVRCLSAEYTAMPGTSMASPHVAGAAALVLAYRPSASVADVRAALLSGVDRVTALAGRTVTGGRLNVHGALRAIGGGTEPEPEPEPTPDPTPEPTPDPTPEPTPDPTPEPDPTPDPGPDPIGPDPEPADRTAPRLSGLQLAPASFRPAPRGRGSALRLRLSETAEVRIAVVRRGRVVARTRLPAVRSGATLVRFTGRIAGRTLRRGAYRLVLTAIDAAGNRSAAASIAFRIKP